MPLLPVFFCSCLHASDCISNFFLFLVVRLVQDGSGGLWRLDVETGEAEKVVSGHAGKVCVCVCVCMHACMHACLSV